MMCVGQKIVHINAHVPTAISITCESRRPRIHSRLPVEKWIPQCHREPNDKVDAQTARAPAPWLQSWTLLWHTSPTALLLLLLTMWSYLQLFSILGWWRPRPTGFSCQKDSCQKDELFEVTPLLQQDDKDSVTHKGKHKRPEWRDLPRLSRRPRKFRQVYSLTFILLPLCIPITNPVFLFAIL